MSLDTVADILMQRAIHYMYKRAWIGAVNYSLILALLFADDKEGEEITNSKSKKDPTESSIINRMKTAMTKNKVQGCLILSMSR